MIDMIVLVVDYASWVSDLHFVRNIFVFYIISLFVQFPCGFCKPYSISYSC